jgi:hypothetical protein
MNFYFAWFAPNRVGYHWRILNDAGSAWWMRHHWRDWGVTRFHSTDADGKHWSTGQFSIVLGPIRIDRKSNNWL